MKVKILLHLPRTIDGKHIGPFSQGQVCDLDDDIANTFIASAMAVEHVASLESDPEPAPAAKVVVPETGAEEAARAAAEGQARRLRRGQAE